MKRSSSHKAAPLPWVNVSALYAVFYQTPNQINAIIHAVPPEHYREVPMFPEQQAGSKGQVRREIIQDLINNGTLTLRPYAVTSTGIQSGKPIRDFLKLHAIEAPAGTHIHPPRPGSGGYQR